MKMLSSKKTQVVLAALAVFVTSPVFAETLSGQIDFTGSITSDTCRLSSPNGDASSIKVEMGTVSVEDIGTVANPKFTGSGSRQVNFDIICKTASKVSMNLAGSAPEVLSGNNILRVNNGTASPGFAKGVGIAVFDSAAVANPRAYNLTDGALLKEEGEGAADEVRRVSFAAAYVTTGGALEPGIANASLPFTLTYE